MMIFELSVDITTDAEGTTFYRAMSPSFDKFLESYGGPTGLSDGKFVFYTREKATIVRAAVATMLEIIAERVRRLGFCTEQIVDLVPISVTWSSAAADGPDAL
jgi:hypothetical protein